MTVVFFYSWINISPRYWVNWIILCLFQKWQQFLQKQDLTAVFCSESEKWKFVFWASLRSWILDNIPLGILPDNRLKITIQKSLRLFYDNWFFEKILGKKQLTKSSRLRTPYSWRYSAIRTGFVTLLDDRANKGAEIGCSAIPDKGGGINKKEFDVMLFQKSPAIMSSTSSSETPSLFRITFLEKCRIKRDKNLAFTLCSIYKICN